MVHVKPTVKRTEGKDESEEEEVKSKVGESIHKSVPSNPPTCNICNRPLSLNHFDTDRERDQSEDQKTNKQTYISRPSYRGSSKNNMYHQVLLFLSNTKYSISMKTSFLERNI